jgi:hypothetical protein
MAKYPSDQAVYRMFNSGSGYQLKVEGKNRRVIAIRNVLDYAHISSGSSLRYHNEKIRNEYSRLVDVIGDDL